MSVATKRRLKSYALGLSSALALSLSATTTRAQNAASAPVPAPTATSPADGPAASAPTPPAAGPSADASSSAAIDALAAKVDTQSKALADTQKKLEDLSGQVAAIPPPAEHKFQLYGYTDVGIDGLWSKGVIAKVVTPGNTATFAVGNVDLYMDAQPFEDWRSLVEVRFSNAPQGEVTSFGGLAGTFHRTSTFGYDPNAATPNQYVLFGSTVIERAQIDWSHFDFFKVRAGLFLTPFGIWNMDHGTPTLIALQLPQALAYNMFPSQQTGIMISGSHQFGPWETGYMATVSNGRQDFSNMHFAGNPLGYGGRIYANNESGKVAVKLGISGYTDRPTDQEIDVTAVSPLALSTKTNIAYREYTGGVDVSVDIGSTRLRAEAVIHKVTYDPGEHESVQLAIGTQQPNRIEQTAYILAAHQLPFLGLEPFAVVDTIYGPLQGVGNLAVSPSVGLNIHFNASVQLKTQIARSMFFNVRGASNYDGADLSDNNLTMFYSRLVVAF